MNISTEQRLLETEQHIVDLTDVAATSKDDILSLRESLEQLTSQLRSAQQEQQALHAEVTKLINQHRDSTASIVEHVTQRVDTTEIQVALMSRWIKGTERFLNDQLVHINNKNNIKHNNQPINDVAKRAISELKQSLAS